jgi:hypothetical protein
MRVCRRVAVFVLLLCAATLGAAWASEVPETLRAELEAPLKKKAADLLAEKDADGSSFKRGTFSKSFVRVDDSTYHASFMQDTASPGSLKVERLRITLSRKAPGQWTISKEEVLDTYEGLKRTVLGQEAFYRFATASFEQEGLRVKAGAGGLYAWSLEGKMIGMKIVAPDLAFEYAPPAELNVYQAVRAKIYAEHAHDFEFKPKSAVLVCDPATCASMLERVFSGLEKVGAAEPAVRKEYDSDMEEERKNRKENPFRGFRLPSAEDRRNWAFRFQREGGKGEHYFYLDSDSYEPLEVQVGASGYGTIFAYNSEETRKSGIPAYDIERRPDFESRNYELDGLRGTVEVALDGDTLRGDVTYDMTITHELRELPFFISRRTLPSDDKADAKNPRMYVNSLQDGEGEELSWVRTGPFSGLVILPKVAEPGDKLTLRLQYTNLDSIRQLNPSYSEVDRGGWLPFVRFTDMIEKFDLTVKSPAKYTLMGVGRKESEKVEGNLRTTRWVASSPVSFPTIIFGDYISDESSVRAEKLDRTQIPVRVYVDKISTTSIDERVITTSGTEKDADELRSQLAAGARDIRGKQLKTIADQAANALNLYRSIYGVDYPYDKLDLVADPLGSYYGQAPASIVYLGFGVFRGEGYVASDTLFGGGGARIAKFNKDVVAHEVAHQWWGSLINNANTRNYWFVESLAEYSSALYVEAVNSEGGKNPAKGRKAYLEKVAGWRSLLLQAGLLGSVQNATVTWGGERPGFAYVANVYNKGPYAFHVLRETFGDQKFFTFLKAMASELKYTGIVTRDIQRIAEQSFGGNMDWFFDQWLRGVGIPQYAFNYTVRKTEDGKYLVEGTVRQRVVIGADKTPVPNQFYRAVATVTAVGRDKKDYPARILVEKQETPFKFKVPVEPIDVVFNKNGEVLAADVFVNRGF